MTLSTPGNQATPGNQITPAQPTARAHRAPRHLALLAALIAALAVLISPSPPVVAEPGGTTATSDDEGGTEKLRKQLEAAARGYLDASVALEQSRKRQRELTGQLAAMGAEVTVRSKAVDEMAGAAYRSGRVGTLSALLGSGSPDEFLDRALSLNVVAATQSGALNDLTEARARATQAKTALESEIPQQQKQLAIMAERKKQAEQALAAAGATQAGSGVSSGYIRWAKPAPRNADGSWPSESCSVDDPTTSGCITPRTLHALNQAKAAGFTRYVSCYRPGTSGEHPKGRACDFAAQTDGFGGAATGGDRTYGNNLAAFFVRNADRLGVLYVIWYRQIWLPGSGWRSYSGSGSPSAEHTNHVHLSVY
jgi:hypothetical protein